MPKEQGFSLLELVVAAGITALLSFGLMTAYQNFDKAFLATAAEQMVTAKLKQTRQMAATQRRTLTVTFVGPATLQIAGGQIMSQEAYVLPGGYAFDQPTDSPSHPGGATTDLKDKSVSFLGDGSVVDPATGDPIAGVVYLSKPSDPNQSACNAVTVVGATGHVRSYYLDKGTNVWK